MLKVALTQQKGNHDAVTLTYLGQSCLAALVKPPGQEGVDSCLCLCRGRVR